MPADPVEVDSPHRHRRIYLDLEGKIKSGEIANQEQLPILPDLCVRYGVSAASVRRALDDLERNGLISRRRGKGTFAIGRTTIIPPKKTRTFRVLLIGETWDLYREPIEAIHYMFDILAGIRDAAREQSAAVALISQAGPGRMPPHEEGIGYLVLTMGMKSYALGLEMAQSQGAPCVLVNPPEPLTPCVRVDITEGARLGVRHLIDLGHRRIAYIGATRGSYFQERVAGYHLALEQSGLDSDPALVPSGVHTDEQSKAALDTLLALPSPPTALFVQSDYRALLLMAYARSLGLSLPGALSICGYDNISEAATVDPPLTSVHHPRYEQGIEAVHLLTCLLDGETPPTLDVTITPHVVQRASTSSLTIS